MNRHRGISVLALLVLFLPLCGMGPTACAGPRAHLCPASPADELPAEGTARQAEPPRFRLALECRNPPAEDEARAVVLAALRDVEAELGRIETEVVVEVVDEIPSRSPAYDGHRPPTTSGRCSVLDDGTIRIQACRLEFGPELLRHEFTHAWCRSRKLEPPLWLEEGVAHLLESDDGLVHCFVPVLRERGAMSEAHLEGDLYRDNDTEWRRAVAWAIARRAAEEGCTAGEILTRSSTGQWDFLPSPRLAVETALAEVSRRTVASQNEASHPQATGGSEQ